MDVGDWLRGLGLGQYEAAFRESEIEADVLGELTDQHLKDLGVSLGNRLRILRAIRELFRRRSHPGPGGRCAPGGIISLQGGGIIQESLGAIIPL